MNYPSYIQTAISNLEAAGHSAYVVGGALRDALLDSDPYDWDVTTDALPSEMLEIFKEFDFYTAGLKHGTLSVIIEKHAVEITTFRVDGAYTDSRHPDAVTFTPNLEDDLSRRDFTVNALAYSQKTGLVDLFGGKNDLENGVIRAVGDPEKRFKEDALRILRGFRFASKLGFAIEENTLHGMEKCREGLKNIAAERITAELQGIVVGKNAYEVLCLMQKIGIFPLAVDPELSKLPQEFPIRAAFLLKNEKDLTLLQKLRLSNATVAHIKTLVSLLPLAEKAKSDYEVRKLMAKAGEYASDLCLLAKIPKPQDCLSLSELAVDGKTLTDMGYRGKEVGEILQFLFDEVLRDPEANKKDILLDKLKK